MSQMATEGAIREILATHGQLSRPAAEVRADADLFTVGLDSQAVVNVMLAIEERFDFEFPEDRLNRSGPSPKWSKARARRHERGWRHLP